MITSYFLLVIVINYDQINSIENMFRIVISFRYFSEALRNVCNVLQHEVNSYLDKKMIPLQIVSICYCDTKFFMFRISTKFCRAFFLTALRWHPLFSFKLFSKLLKLCLNFHVRYFHQKKSSKIEETQHILNYHYF